MVSVPYILQVALQSTSNHPVVSVPYILQVALQSTSNHTIMLRLFSHPTVHCLSYSPTIYLSTYCSHNQPSLKLYGQPFTGYYTPTYHSTWKSITVEKRKNLVLQLATICSLITVDVHRHVQMFFFLSNCTLLKITSSYFFPFKQGIYVGIANCKASSWTQKAEYRA